MNGCLAPPNTVYKANSNNNISAIFLLIFNIMKLDSSYQAWKAYVC